MAYIQLKLYLWHIWQIWNVSENTPAHKRLFFKHTIYVVETTYEEHGTCDFTREISNKHVELRLAKYHNSW